jgi:hypothetical protein
MSLREAGIRDDLSGLRPTSGFGAKRPLKPAPAESLLSAEKGHRLNDVNCFPIDGRRIDPPHNFNVSFANIVIL